MNHPSPARSYELYFAVPAEQVWRGPTDGAISFDGESETYRQSAQGWPVILSSMKTLLETGSRSSSRGVSRRAKLVCEAQPA